MRKLARTLIFLLVAGAIWLPTLGPLHRLDANARRDIADRLARATPARVETMRSVNPEWDFMTRTYTVLALANRALAHPGERSRDLARIDAIVDATIAVERDDAQRFLLPYARSGPFRDPDARSLFIDGELLTMIAARDRIEPREATRAEARQRATRVERAMRSSPSLSGESYPDECWTFCNTTALAGLVMFDAAAYEPLARDWIAHAKAHLVDPSTGLLVSSYTWDGKILDGPEGSSIWMSASNLLVLDEPFARDQYTRAKRELGVSFLGFGWAREWPQRSSARKSPDVDSGPIVPVLEASPGSSGLALLGAASFGDEAWYGSLLASLELTGFRDDRSGRYRASNDVGDAVLLYSLSFGPLWDRARSRSSLARVER